METKCSTCISGRATQNVTTIASPGAVNRSAQSCRADNCKALATVAVLGVWVAATPRRGAHSENGNAAFLQLTFRQRTNAPAVATTTESTCREKTIAVSQLRCRTNFRTVTGNCVPYPAASAIACNCSAYGIVPGG